MKDYGDVQRSPAADFVQNDHVTDDVNEDTTPDLFVTIRFHSAETDSASCLQVGGHVQRDGAHDPHQRGAGGDCAAVVEADWQWERVTAPDGVSLLHTFSAEDIVGILETGGNVRAAEWDICVSSSCRCSCSSGCSSG